MKKFLKGAWNIHLHIHSQKEKQISSKKLLNINKCDYIQLDVACMVSFYIFRLHVSVKWVLKGVGGAISLVCMVFVQFFPWQQTACTGRAEGKLPPLPKQTKAVSVYLSGAVILCSCDRCASHATLFPHSRTVLA